MATSFCSKFAYIQLFHGYALDVSVSYVLQLLLIFTIRDYHGKQYSTIMHDNSIQQDVSIMVEHKILLNNHSYDQILQLMGNQEISILYSISMRSYYTILKFDNALYRLCSDSTLQYNVEAVWCQIAPFIELPKYFDSSMTPSTGTKLNILENLFQQEYLGEDLESFIVAQSCKVKRITY